MKNNFAEEFATYMGLEKAWDDAEMDDATEEELDVIRDELREFKDELGARGYGYWETFRDYVDAKRFENAYIDKDDINFETAEQMIARFREYGIERFTWSSDWTGAVDDAWKFIECGCRLEGMTLVNTGWDKRRKEYDKKPAYVFCVC